MIFNSKKTSATLAITVALTLGGATTVSAEGLSIASAKDWGNGHASYPASNTIDGSLAWASRWAASGSPVNLELDLGSVQSVDAVGISFGKGGERTHSFEIWARASSSDSWTKVRPKGDSTGNTSSIESYDIDDIEARYVRIKTHSNSDGTSWTNIKEVEVYGAEGSGELTIDKIFDDGTSHLSYPASKANDGSSAWASRWAAEAGGAAVNLTAEFNETQRVENVGVSWGRGDERAHTFEIYARNATSGSWTKVYDGVASGTTTGIETYDVTDIDARQVRLKVQSNTSGSNWSNVTEMKVYGSVSTSTPEEPSTPENPEAPAPGDADVPSDLMRNVDQWKITFPDGEEVKQLEGVSNEYFYVNDDQNGIVFYAPVRSDNGTTPNSSYIRSELRERTADGKSDIYWTTDGKHVVYAKQAITHLPIVKPHLVATQIHGDKEAGIDDSLVLRLEDEHLFLSFNGGKLRDDVTIKTDYKLGTLHEVIFEVVDGKHYVYYSEDGNLNSAYNAGNASQYLVKDGSSTVLMDLDYDQSYFKIGNYTQSNAEKEGDETDDPNNYGEVVVYDFWVDHE